MCVRYITAIWDEIVTWCYGGIELTDIKYGLLYNWYAATDSRNICPIGWHVPTDIEWGTLATYLGGQLVAGGKLKETGLVYWNTPNTGATNEVGFNARGSGQRNPDGSFTNIKIGNRTWASNASNDWECNRNNATLANATGISEKYGCALRPIKDSTILTHGQTGIYIDPSGVAYRTICIGTQEWVADNIITKHYRNGDPIPEVPLAAGWIVLETGAWCYFNNDSGYM